MTQEEWDDWKKRSVHEVVFRHAWGWRVEKLPEGVFWLVSDDYQNFGFIGSFGTCEAAISYMNNEFLGLTP